MKLLSLFFAVCHAVASVRAAGQFVSRLNVDITGAGQKMLDLPPLPYEYNALEPYVSENTLRVHHGKHHAKYVSNTVAFIQGTNMEDRSLVDIIHYAKENNKDALYNNAAQCFNHEFYWHCLRPDGGGEPVGTMAALISSTYGSFTNFRAKFTDAANSLFGSGWVWLLRTSTGLEIVPTRNAECPIDRGVPLLVLDVWEHAYYLDYQNRRFDYVDVFFDKLVNWDFAAAQLMN